MSDWAALLTGIAAIVTSVGGPAVAIYALTRGSPRERQRAAQNAVDRVFSDDEDDDEMAALLEELLRRRQKDEP